jgi:hypothetical protein
MKVSVNQIGHDTRDLVEMLTEQRSRAEKEGILRAIWQLRRDDKADAAEAAHLDASNIPAQEPTP